MKHLTKKASLLVCVALLCTLLFGCAAGSDNSTGSSTPTTTPTTGETSAPETVTANVFGLVGPTGVGMANLMKQTDDGTAQGDYRFTLVSSPDEVVAKIANGEADIAAVPSNLAATLYKKTSGNVKLLAVSTLGVLYMLENGDTIQSVSDLKGQTIYSTGQGANPEYVLRYVLAQNGIDPDKDVTLEFVEQNEELATLMVSGKAKVAMVPEPLSTTIQSKNADVRVALSMTEEWDALDSGSQLMMTGVIVRSEFLQEHEEAVKTFLTEYEASIQAAKTDVSGTAQLCVDYGIIAAKAIAEQAIPRCNLTYIAGADMKAQISGYYQVLFDANPASIGGALPDDAFYYNAG